MLSIEKSLTSIHSHPQQQMIGGTAEIPTLGKKLATLDKAQNALKACYLSRPPFLVDDGLLRDSLPGLRGGERRSA